MTLADTPEETYTEVGVPYDEGGYKSGGILQDTALWVLIPFLIVIGIFWKFGVHKRVGDQLDSRIDTIAKELDEARTMREEAQELLAQYQRRQREAEEEAQDIIDQAKQDAILLGEEMRAKLEEQLARRAKAAEDKIARAEAQAIADVRNQTAELAVAAAANLIKDKMPADKKSGLVDKSIADIKSRLN